MKKLLSLAWLLLCIVLSNTCMAESTLPFYLVNNSHFNDDEVYVALVGKQDGTHIWMDLSTNSSANPAIKNMNTSYNTLHKINGDWGYGNIFMFGVALKQGVGNQIDVSSFFTWNVCCRC